MPSAGIVELIHVKGVVNADFADVKTVMSVPGLGPDGLWAWLPVSCVRPRRPSGLSLPRLLEEVSITGAKGILG